MAPWSYRQVPYKVSNEQLVVATCGNEMCASHLMQALRKFAGEDVMPDTKLEHSGELYANVLGLRIHQDPSVPDSTIELRDPTTGRVLGRFVGIG